MPLSWTQRIAALTLIIVGDRDIVTPEHAVEMFRTIPNGRLCVIPGVGHGAMPKEAVRAFLEARAADQWQPEVRHLGERLLA
jgi:pimeloyl-ACP methyl ester carboxylesterase